MKTLSYFIIIYVCCICRGQNINFFREKISLNILGETCEIEGTYYFKNPTDTEVSRLIYYPFIIEDDLPLPDSISIFDQINQSVINYTMSDSGIHFILLMPPRSIQIILINYTQRTPDHRVEYILTTTKYWRRSFDFAEYQIEIPNEYQLTAMSHNFIKQPSESAKNIYYFKIKNFMPKKNLEIHWKRN